MRVLLFVDPEPVGPSITDVRHFMRSTMRGLGEFENHHGVEVRILAPGGDAGAMAESNAMARMIRGSELRGPELAYLEAIDAQCKRRGAGDTGPLRAYFRGEGESAERLSEYLRRIHDDVFPFDLVVSTSSGLAAEAAAMRLRAASARAEIWPGAGRRWQRLVFFHFRDAEGRDVREDLRREHLLASGFREFAESIDQRQLPVGEEIFPYESRFAPLSGAGAEAFRSERKVAVFVLRNPDSEPEASHVSADDAGKLLESYVPRILAAGWRCLLLTDGGPESEIAETWVRSNDRIFHADSGGRRQTKQEWRDRLTVMSQADLVITPSNSAGLEAALLGRPASIAEGAFYGIEGIFPSPEEVLNGSFDRGRYARDTTLLRGFLLRAYGERLAQLLGRGGFIERAVSGSELNRTHAGDPGGWVRALHETFGKAAEARLVNEELPRASFPGE